MTTRRLSGEIAAAAAQAVVDEGLEIASARRRAARQLGGRGLRPNELPRNEDVEDAVREHLATFHADDRAQVLRALRLLAARWMERLAAHRPHLGGAVWRGIAYRQSAVVLDLYCDDPKSAEIDLLNRGVDFDAGGGGDGDGGPGDVSVLTLADRAPGLADAVTVHLLLHDLDDLRGALKPDARGRSWRGDLPALQRVLHEEAP